MYSYFDIFGISSNNIHETSCKKILDVLVVVLVVFQVNKSAVKDFLVSLSGALSEGQAGNIQHDNSL